MSDAGAARRRRADAERRSPDPDHRTRTPRPTDSQPFLQDLARRGLIRADALGMGLEVDSRSRAVAEPHVEALPVLVAGPAARGRLAN